MDFFLILYNLALLCGVVLLAPIWLLYLATVPKVRAGFWQKAGFGKIPGTQSEHSPTTPEHQQTGLRGFRRPRLWFHAVSVGEFNAIKTLVPALGEHYEIFISTTTLTGQILARTNYPALSVFYFPYDFRLSVKQRLNQVNPDLVVVMETELWPNLIDLISARKIPLLLINGRLSQRSAARYNWIQPLMKHSLNQFTHLYMQSQADADRMQALGDLGPEQLTVVGNLKFDLNATVLDRQKRALQHLLGFKDGDTVLTLASTHSGEDEFLIDAYMRLKRDFPEIKLVLAPRHPERLQEIKSILNAKAQSYSVRSFLRDDAVNHQAIVVLDSIGELLVVYSFTTVAIMGGSFIQKGGQNPLEALSQRVPVVFGPNMQNFQEISRLILEAEAGYQVFSEDGLHNAIAALLTQPEVYDSVAENGQQLLENNRGAKSTILQAIQDAVGLKLNTI